MPTSPESAIRVDDEALRRACAEAVEELKAARKLLAAQKVEIEKQKELLELEREISAKAKEIGRLSEMEKDELRRALAAKDRQIAALEEQIKVLKKKRFTFWKAVKVVIVAGAAGVIIGKVL